MESTHRAYSDQVSLEKKTALVRANPKVTVPDPNNFRIIAPAGHWASGVRIVSPFSLKTTSYHPLGENEAAVSIALVKFDRFKEDSFVLVGSVKDFVMVPKSYSECYVRTFIFDKEGKSMDFLYNTTMDGMPLSIHPHKGMILAGIGSKLRLYDVGKKQLLKKCEYKHSYTGINNICTMGERIFVSDVSDSFHLLKHKSREN